MNEMIAWERFEQTGSVKAYIEYREVRQTLTGVFGKAENYASENQGHCPIAEESRG